VTERYSPLDTLLDVFVYAPVGLALVATEEIPKLAAKGRAQLGGQLAMAKVVGQFAVAQGRRQLKPRPAAPSRRRGPAPAQPASPAAASDQPGSTGPGGPADPGRGGPEPAGPGPDGRIRTGAENDAGAAPAGATDRAATVDSPDREADQAGDRAGDDVGPGVGSAHVSSPPSEPVGLGIPGYDSLAASQVVPRLAGLSAAELAAVGAYESAHRSRRTILTRVRQLQER
jgi:hypothetical protein